MNSLIPLLLAGFALHVLWTVTKPRWHFRIVVKPDDVDFFGIVPVARRKTLEHFFLNDLRSSQNLSICGRLEKSGQLSTLILGTDDEGLKQRIRNFLVSTLQR